jgi:hypothetical protein
MQHSKAKLVLSLGIAIVILTGGPSDAASAFAIMHDAGFHPPTVPSLRT